MAIDVWLTSLVSTQYIPTEVSAYHATKCKDNSSPHLQLICLEGHAWLRRHSVDIVSLATWLAKEAFCGHACVPW